MLKEVRINVHGINLARAPDSPGGPHRKPTRAGADIGYRYTWLDAQDVHYALHLELLRAVFGLEHREIAAVRRAGLARLWLDGGSALRGVVPGCRTAPQHSAKHRIQQIQCNFRWVYESHHRDSSTKGQEATFLSLHGNEVHEHVKHARETGNKGIGLTIAVLAVLSAFVAMLLNHTSTEKVIVETKIADWWAYTHSNDSNARLYDVDARLAELNGAVGASVAAELRKERDRQTKDSDEARAMAQKLERESQTLTRKWKYYGSAELFLQFSMVLCSIALLTDLSIFWKSSFVSAMAGVALVVWGLVLH
jgi:hypothetical protein